MCGEQNSQWKTTNNQIPCGRLHEQPRGPKNHRQFQKFADWKIQKKWSSESDHVWGTE